MLVLSRKRDESIIIGDDIVITIVDIRGDKVRIGIEAPRETTVHRQEVYEAIRQENKASNTEGLNAGTTSTEAEKPRKTGLRLQSENAGQPSDTPSDSGT